ncbi:MAG: LLM class flavin-dependent oxidoreductase, partial [Ilumatobacter sp.]|nr:LLM class flavin-dependent oxidoreductase [Ilumatobacter sp.]
MKVRIGYGLGTRTRLHDESFGAVVDSLESLGFDSLWLSEKISGEAPDPLVAMAYGSGRTTELKFGMSV